MDWIVDPFELAFQQRALIGGVLAGVLTSVVGAWVVIRGMSFMGDAVAHGVIPGVAIAILLGVNPVWGALLAGIVMIWGINLVHQHTKLSSDVGIGLLFVGMLALGVVVISLTPTFSGSIAAILFGDLLGVTWDVIWLEAIGLVVALALSYVMYRPFLALAFNADKAEMMGFRPQVAHFALLALITGAVVLLFQGVGAILVFGLLVGPPATAIILVRRVVLVMVVSGICAIFAVVAGLLISYHYSTAASATIVLISVVVFFLVLTGSRVRNALMSKPPLSAEA
ncbi:MAG: metal ABC transporter permease [bacterium]|nr:metal ABC transporter permease [Acidimicrobiia bacterium]MCY4651492.1 metal ABC transporter permease [bacterium]